MEFRRVDAERIERARVSLQDLEKNLPMQIALAVSQGVRQGLEEAGVPALKAEVSTLKTESKVIKVISKIVLGSGMIVMLIQGIRKFLE